MPKIISLIFIPTLFISLLLLVRATAQKEPSGAPPGGAAFEEVPRFLIPAFLEDWERPDGPTKVALQVGHWKNDELPEELGKLKGNSGATGGGKAEWEANFAIAEAAAEILEEEGIEVEILPATIPPLYWADVFVSIHADGSLDSSKRGFKVAAPWRDFTGGADELVGSLEQTYQEATDWEIDPNVTRNMRGYYAFSWWRYKHALHPMTTAAIFETGFLTNPLDRQVLINNPSLPASAIAEGILRYLD